MQSLVTLAVRVNRWLALVGAAAVVAMMVHICVDVALRNLFRMSMNTTPEIVARYYMVGIAFLPLGWIELRRQMVSVELIDAFLSPRMRRLSDVLVCLIAAVVYAVLARSTFLNAVKEAKSGTFVELVSWQMPVWHSYFLPAIGFGFAGLACVLTAIATLWPGLSPKTEDLRA